LIFGENGLRQLNGEPLVFWYYYTSHNFPFVICFPVEAENFQDGSEMFQDEAEYLPVQVKMFQVEPDLFTVEAEKVPGSFQFPARNPVVTKKVFAFSPIRVKPLNRQSGLTIQRKTLWTKSSI